jgi:hypothetical protein
VSRSTWDTSRPDWDFAYWPLTIYGRPFQIFLLSRPVPHRGPATPPGKPDGLGCYPFARHYSGNRFCFLFHRILRCFTSPGIALEPYIFRPKYPAMTRDGFPHSEIFGSKRACRSPKLIAAYHVLHRLLMPRHPLCALSSLTKIAWSYTSALRSYHTPLCSCQRTIPLRRKF